jgi:FAD-dependent urate hydroxylase
VTRRAVVVGAGIAGPVLAMFLQRAGWAPVVHEARASDAAHTGSYFNLAGNGLAVLAELDRPDLMRHLATVGTPTTRIEFHDHQGRLLGANPAPSTLIRRDRLAALLRWAAETSGIPLRYGSRLRVVDNLLEDRVVARFDDGEVTADLVAGCDGIHSAVRRAILPDGPAPLFTGMIDGGGTARLGVPPPADGVLRLTFGCRAYFGYQMLPGGAAAWFQNSPALPAGLSDQGWRAHLTDLHRDDHPPIRELISGTAGPLHRWPVHELPSLETWHRGRVCVLGDAAHAMSPHDGQGASMALEDALVLARCLRGGAAPADAFARFELLRRDRVERIAEQSRRTGRSKFPANDRARQMRDRLLPHLLQQGVSAAAGATETHLTWSDDDPTAT